MIQRQPANGVLLVVFILAIFFLNPIAIAQTHDLKFNLVSGANGILLGKINSMTGKGQGGGHHLRKRQRPRNPRTHQRKNISTILYHQTHRRGYRTSVEFKL
jgi:hypothetical protein